MKVVNTYHLGNDMVRAICMDALHRIWVGYFGYGIEVFSPQMKRIKSFYSTNGRKGVYSFQCGESSDARFQRAYLGCHQRGGYLL